MSPDAGALERRDDDQDRSRPGTRADVEAPRPDPARADGADREREALRAAAREAHERALAATRAKSEFLATMSHEMRTPLNAVLGYTDLLALGVPGALNPDQRSYLDRIRGAASRLLALINDVLDLARLDAGRLTIARERGNAGTAVATALELVAPLAEGRGVRVLSRCGADVDFIADRKRVEQIVQQLLSNAIRFSVRGATVTVGCTRFDTPAAEAADRSHGCWCAVRVEDAGVGIGEADQSSIFEPFTQVDSSHSRAESGTGLGLALARRLARLMGGDLTVESRPGQGSAFTLWIPAPARTTADGAADGCNVRERRGDTRRAPGLVEIGRAIAGDVEGLVDRFVDRMIDDPRIATAATTDRRTLEDHTAAFIADIGQALSVVGSAEGEPQQIMRDSADIQLLIAARHGALRQRGGWTEDEIDVEYDVLTTVITEAVHAAPVGAPEDAIAAALSLLERFLGRAREEGRRAYRRSALGILDDAPADSTSTRLS